ncbi:MAG: nuclear transport factor 2 family protein [Candidatus Sulfotelmatobacter sp.]
MLSIDDREEIGNLVRSADEAATRRDDAAYAALYAQDGVMEGIKGNAEGRAAIRAAVRVVWAREPAGSEHLTRDVTIGEE